MARLELPRISGRPAQIAEVLGRRIFSGELPAGSILPPEADLLEQLGVSRTTLREAFKILSAKRLISARPKVGTLVCPAGEWSLLDPDVLSWLFDSGNLEETLAELYDIRRMIETEAAGMAADMASGADLARMAAAYDRLAAEAARGEDALGADVAFHRAIIEASGNRFMAALATVSETALRTTVKLSVRRPGGMPHSLPLHAAVLRRIEARDADGARAAMRELIQNAQSDAIEVARARLRDRSRG